MTHKKDADVLQLSASQRRLWFLEQMDSGGTAWNIQVVFRVRGPLDAQALQRCVGDLLERHESLRTTFEVGDDGEPVQVIWPYTGHAQPYVDLVATAGQASRDEAARWAERQWQQPFDIVNGPLIRTAVLRVAPDEHHLVIDVHHLVADAWSLKIIYRELCALYAARVSGREGPVLPELPVQYGDFAVWEADQVSDANQEPALAVWRRRLASAPAPSVFPPDHPKTSQRSVRGSVSTASLPQALMAGIRRLCGATGASTFMVALAVFDTMLLRYSGEDDLIIGSAAPSRVHPDTEDLIGCFINPIVLRTDLSGNPTFREVLGRVGETVVEAYENQHVSFDRLVADLKPGRNDVTRPFFQTLLQTAEIGLEPARMGELDIDMTGFSSEVAGIDLAVTLVERESGLTAAWEYDDDLYERTTIERMQRHFLTLLESAVAQPDVPIRLMPMLDDDERRRLAPGPSLSGETAPHLHRLVERHAQAAPAATALLARQARVSYGELNKSANRMARALQAEGVGPESVVGVCLSRGPDLPVVMLAILKAGGCYLPLDPGYPAERLAFMTEDSAAALVIGDDPGLPCRTLPIARLVELAADLSDQDLPAASRPHASAYVIYTSGSTGKPKGVQVQHDGLANVAQAQLALFGLTPGDRVGQFFSPNFDASVFEITMAFGAGATLVVTTPEEVVPGGRLARTFRDTAVTAVTMTPSALTALGQAHIPTLRVVSAAAEACPLAALRPWLAQARCFNLYGPTEATIWATSQEVGRPDEEQPAMLPIGTAIPGTGAYVLDKSMNPVPELVTGELYIGGAGVTRGYLRRPQLTAERFLPDPFSPLPAARMYRTGDLARRRSDGRLEFLRRTDDQIKIRGHRVELGEVEAIVGECPRVRQCAAVANENQLVCHVVPAEDGGDASTAPSAAEILAYAAARLPGYLVPDAIMLRDRLPTLPSGKVDRDALRNGHRNGGAGDAPYIAPRTAMEDFLAGLWKEVLRVDQVGVQDDFFDLGGHSLAATLVVTRLKADLGLDIPVTLLFDHRVLETYTQAVLDCAGQTDSEFAALS